MLSIRWSYWSSECGPSNLDGFPGLPVAMARGQVQMSHISNTIKAVLTLLIDFSKNMLSMLIWRGN